jgi:UDP-glucose 4-epimerase
MHYLVTGGAGFIGSHLCEALLKGGHRLTVLDNLSTGKRENLPDNVHLIEGDAADRRVLSKMMPNVDGVFHLAAIASVQQSIEAWADTSHANQFATIALLEAISKRVGGMIPFVYASSAAVYGDPDASYLPITESTHTLQLTPYGADKLGSEQHARIARHLFGIPTLGLRFFNVYGERQDPSSPYSGVISIFMDRLSQGQGITIFGDGQQTRDFIYVGDVVARLIAAMELLERGEQPKAHAINVCHGQATSLLELAGAIAKLHGITPNMTHAPARAGDIAHSLGDASVSHECLKCAATISLEEGLSRMIG